MVLRYYYSSLDIFFFFFFQAEDGIRDLVRSRGLGDVYKRQPPHPVDRAQQEPVGDIRRRRRPPGQPAVQQVFRLSLIHI